MSEERGSLLDESIGDIFQHTEEVFEEYEIDPETSGTQQEMRYMNDAHHGMEGEDLQTNLARDVKTSPFAREPTFTPASVLMAQGPPSPPEELCAVSVSLAVTEVEDVQTPTSQRPTILNDERHVHFSPQLEKGSISSYASNLSPEDASTGSSYPYYSAGETPRRSYARGDLGFLDSHLTHNSGSPEFKQKYDELQAKCEIILGRMKDAETALYENENHCALLKEQGENRLRDHKLRLEYELQPTMSRCEAEVTVMSKQILSRHEEAVQLEQTIANLKTSIEQSKTYAIEENSRLLNEIDQCCTTLCVLQQQQEENERCEGNALQELSELQKKCSILLETPGYALPYAEVARSYVEGKTSHWDKTEQQLNKIVASCAERLTACDKAQIEKRARIKASVKQTKFHRKSENSQCAEQLKLILMAKEDFEGRLRDVQKRTLKVTEHLSDLRAQHVESIEHLEEELSARSRERIALQESLDQSSQTENYSLLHLPQINTEPSITHLDFGSTAEMPTVPQSMQPRVQEESQMLQTSIMNAEKEKKTLEESRNELGLKLAEAKAALRREKAFACLHNVEGVTMTPHRPTQIESCGSPIKSAHKESSSEEIRLPSPEEMKTPTRKRRTAQREGKKKPRKKRR